MAQSNLWPKKKEATQAAKRWRSPPLPPRRREGASAPAHHHPALSPEQAAKAEDMGLDVKELILPQGGDSKMDERGPQGQDVLSFVLFSCSFLFGGDGEQERGRPYFDSRAPQSFAEDCWSRKGLRSYILESLVSVMQMIYSGRCTAG